MLGVKQPGGPGEEKGSSGTVVTTSRDTGAGSTGPMPWEGLDRGTLLVGGLALLAVAWAVLGGD